jgi:hypothetical protein
VKLDPVRGDTGLAVEEVEESNADDSGAGAEPHPPPRRRHLPTPQGCGSGRAGRRRGFSDHVPKPLVENEMEVAVVLETNERDPSDDAVDMPLEGKPGRGQVRRSR